MVFYVCSVDLFICLMSENVKITKSNKNIENKQCKQDFVYLLRQTIYIAGK